MSIRQSLTTDATVLYSRPLVYAGWTTAVPFWLVLPKFTSSSAACGSPSNLTTTSTPRFWKRFFISSRFERDHVQDGSIVWKCLQSQCSPLIWSTSVYCLHSRSSALVIGVMHMVYCWFVGNTARRRLSCFSHLAPDTNDLTQPNSMIMVM